MKKAIKIALAAGVLCGVVFGSIKLLELTKKKEVTKKYSVISTSFPGYDFARAVAGNNTDINVKMLLKPGASHILSSRLLKIFWRSKIVTCLFMSGVILMNGLRKLSLKLIQKRQRL